MANKFRIRVVDEGALAVHHIKIRTILVVVLPQQAGEHAGGPQIDGAGDIAEVALVCREDGVGEADEVVAGEGDKRI